jgi:hypothetical protein
MPKPRAYGARCEKRNGAVAAGAGRRGDPAGTSRRAAVPAAHRAGCDRSSNPHSSACGQHYGTSESLRISSRTTTAGIKPVTSAGHKPASRKCRRKPFRAAKSPANSDLLFFSTVSVRGTQSSISAFSARFADRQAAPAHRRGDQPTVHPRWRRVDPPVSPSSSNSRHQNRTPARFLSDKQTRGNTRYSVSSQIDANPK